MGREKALMHVTERALRGLFPLKLKKKEKKKKKRKEKKRKKEKSVCEK